MPPARSGEKLSRPPRRSQVDRRETAKRRLLDAAIRLIAERGVKGTTLGDVGEAAGYSRGLTAHHYRTKKGLIEAVAAEIHRQSYQLLHTPAPANEGLAQLLAVIEAYLNTGIASTSGRALHLIQKEALTQQSEFRDVLRNFNRDSIGAFERMIRTGIERNEIRSDIDPRTEATLILAALRGARSQWHIAPNEFDMAAVTAEITTHVQRTLARE